MRQLSSEEVKEVSGALCSNLTMSLGITGVSISGSLGDWGDCFRLAGDRLYSYGAHYSTGIGYGEPHVG